MNLLIDGYNLLNCAGIVVTGDGPYSLEASRVAIAKYLRSILTGKQLRLTTVVFDGRDAPKGLPKQIKILGIDVRFSERGEEADDLIERLIAENHTPRKLTVVSSDHRVQRAARRRRARAVDSDVWFEEMNSARRNSSAYEAPIEEPPTEQVELDVWLDRCADLDVSNDSVPPAEPNNETADEIFSDDYLQSLQDDIDREHHP